MKRRPFRYLFAAAVEDAPELIAGVLWVALVVCFLSAAFFVVASIGVVPGRLL